MIDSKLDKSNSISELLDTKVNIINFDLIYSQFHKGILVWTTLIHKRFKPDSTPNKNEGEHRRQDKTDQAILLSTSASQALNDIEKQATQTLDNVEKGASVDLRYHMLKNRASRKKTISAPNK